MDAIQYALLGGTMMLGSVVIPIALLASRGSYVEPI